MRIGDIVFEVGDVLFLDMLMSFLFDYKSDSTFAFIFEIEDFVLL